MFRATHSDIKGEKSESTSTCVAGVGIIKRTSFKLLFSVCLGNRHLVFEPLETVLVQSLQWPCRTPLIIGNLLVLKQQTNLHIYIILQLQTLHAKNISSLLESHKVDPAIFSGLSFKHSVHHTLTYECFFFLNLSHLQHHGRDWMGGLLVWLFGGFNQMFWWL